MEHNLVVLWCPMLTVNGQPEQEPLYSLAIAEMKKHFTTLSAPFVEHHIRFSIPANDVHRAIYRYGWLFVVERVDTLIPGTLMNLWLSACASNGCCPVGGMESVLNDRDLLKHFCGLLV